MVATTPFPIDERRVPLDAAGRHAKGMVLTFTGVFILSFDMVLVRVIDAAAWDLLPWRTGLMAGAMAFILLMVLGVRGTLRAIWRLGAIGLFVVLVYAANKIAFIVGLEMTNVATLLVILAATPLFAALSARVFYGDRQPLRTWIAILLGLGGIAITTGGWVASGNLLGVAICLGAAFGLGLTLALLQHNPHVDIRAVALLGATLATLVTLQVGDPDSIQGERLAITIFLCAMLLPLAYTLWMFGPKYLSGAETGLMLLLETVLGNLWVWLFLSEAPAPNELLGGVVVLGTVCWHTLATRRAHRLRAAVDTSTSTM